MREGMKKLVMSFMVIVVAVVVFVGTVGSVYALTIDGGRLKSALNEAAKVQVIANTLKRCIPDIKSRSSSGGNVPGLSSQDVKKGDIFGGNSVMVGNTPISGTNVATGPWLENAIDHKGGDDGDIWCAENHGEIIKLFAQYVLGSRSSYMNGIVCDANGEAGGIFIPYSDDGKTEFGCSSAVRYQKKSEDEITNYIKGLYEAKRHELGNDYWVSWDNLGNYTDQRGRAVGYWLYWNDFDTRCKSNDAETNRKTVSLDYGGETFGLVQDETVRVRANWESASFSNIIGNTFTCKTLRDRMDGYAADYAAVSVDYLGSQCKEQLTPVIEGKLEEYRNALASGTVDVQTASNYINKWGNYGSMGNNDFVEQTEKGGYVCNEDAGAKVDFAVDQLTPEESIATGENDACYAGSGALGWLICPVVKMMSGIGEHMWNQIETYHLKLPANDLFENGGGVQQAWGTVRDIANVAFVILFLVVIFSQITGVGIDNYGIKRILPKLIITAILINLSFIICAVAVDLSNIFGMGINSLLTEQADKIAVAQGMSGGVQAASWGMTALLGGGGTALFLVLNPAGALAAAAAIGLAVLGLIITVITSMFFMYITLVVRQAGVILMIVLAPVALACYMLPNTEKLFKKWFDLFKALLIVYPICGALIGAGQLAGAVLASIDSENMKVAAMLVQVVPFFLLPMIIRNSLSLMGNIGGRLSTWGRNLGRRGSNVAQGAIRNTEAMKSLQMRSAENRTRFMAGLDRNGQARNVGRLGRILRGGNRSMERARNQYLRDRSERAREERMMGAGYEVALASIDEGIEKSRSNDQTARAMRDYREEGLEQLIGRWENAFRAGDGDELDALTNVLTIRYGSSAAGRIGDSLSRMNNVANNRNYQASLGTLQRTMNNNSNFAGNMKNKASDAFQMISDRGMAYNQATGQMEYHDLNYFSTNNNASTDVKDWSTQSAATLRRAIAAGALDDEMVSNILNSNDPSVRSGIQSDAGKRDVLQAYMYNRQHNPSGVGPNLSNANAARNYRRDNETRISHEEDAMRIGKTNITIPGVGAGSATSFEGYAVPVGFDAGGTAPTQDANGHYIYTDVNNGRQWDATTGRYVG